jgi:hypothetical protein
MSYLDTSLRWHKSPDFDSIPADIIFREAFQASSQSITAIDIAIWIGEELGYQGGSIL